MRGVAASPERRGRPPPAGAARVVGLGIALMLLLGAVPILSQAIGYRFLPSRAWVDASWPWALTLGAIMAVAGTALAFLGQRRSARPWSILKLALVLPFGAFLCGYIGYDLLVRTFPMVALRSPEAPRA